MHEDENSLCPFPWRKLEVKRLSSLCDNRIGPTKKIYAHAKQYVESVNLSPKDAVHLACARISGADYLLSCDRQFLKRASKLHFDFALMNPVEYAMEVLK
ncbi:MAG TPA: PIN domain-containing protein [Nitrospirota bacterium]|nr:PIN domain-containing protein [Nitrospirota bacterium]